MKIRSKLFVYLLLAAMLLAATMLDRPRESLGRHNKNVVNAESR